jgi:hypothetical protein
MSPGGGRGFVAGGWAQGATGPVVAGSRRRRWWGLAGCLQRRDGGGGAGGRRCRRLGPEAAGVGCGLPVPTRSAGVPVVVVAAAAAGAGLSGLCRVPAASPQHRFPCTRAPPCGRLRSNRHYATVSVHSTAPPGRVHGNRCLMTLRVHSLWYPCATARKPGLHRGRGGSGGDRSVDLRGRFGRTRSTGAGGGSAAIQHRPGPTPCDRRLTRTGRRSILAAALAGGRQAARIVCRCVPADDRSRRRLDAPGARHRRQGAPQT